MLPDFRATVSRLHFWPSVALVAELAALIAALRVLVEASQDRGHTADRKRGGILDRTTFCDGHHIGTGTLGPG